MRHAEHPAQNRWPADHGPREPLPREHLPHDHLPYIIDLWAEDELTVLCLARAAERSIALMAFDAAAVSYPHRVVTVRGPGLNETYQPPGGAPARGHVRAGCSASSGPV